MATRRSKRLQEKLEDIPNKSGDDAVSNNSKRSPLKSLLRHSVDKISHSHLKSRNVTFQSPVAQFQKDGDDLAEELSTKMDLGQDGSVLDAAQTTATMTIDSNLVISDDMSVEVSTTQYGNVQVKDSLAMPPAHSNYDEEPSTHQEVPTTTPAANKDLQLATATPLRRRSSRKGLSKLSRSDLKAGQRPRYLDDVKGKGVLDYLQELLPSIFNLFKMTYNITFPLN